MATKSDDLFAKELAIVERAKGALSGNDDDIPTGEFESLLQGYEKLLRQTKKLMRISDRSEEELNKVAKALDEKNAALKELSTKLSKYLSPQIYEQIFSGERDVATKKKKE